MRCGLLGRCDDANALRLHTLFGGTANGQNVSGSERCGRCGQFAIEPVGRETVEEPADGVSVFNRHDMLKKVGGAAAANIDF